MNTTNFSEIAARYERDSLIQRSAADKLLGLLDIKRDDHVLDLGCGTGNLPGHSRNMTEGAVVGIDASEGMIREASRSARGWTSRLRERARKSWTIGTGSRPYSATRRSNGSAIRPGLSGTVMPHWSRAAGWASRRRRKRTIVRIF